MRKNLKQALVPLAVMVFGAAAAFATNAAKQNEKTDAVMDAFYYDHSKPTGQKCQPIRVDCSNVISENICTNLDKSVQYWETDVENGLTCTGLLYRVN